MSNLTGVTMIRLPEEKTKFNKVINSLKNKRKRKSFLILDEFGTLLDEDLSENEFLELYKNKDEQTIIIISVQDVNNLSKDIKALLPDKDNKEEPVSAVREWDNGTIEITKK
jgi:hypothetical protein